MNTVQLPFIALVIVGIWLVGITIATVTLIIAYSKLQKKRTTKMSILPVDKSDSMAELSQLQQQMTKALQRIGFVRFNPFKDIGGEQSFAIAILDKHGDGIVLSNLHSRSISRTYAKRINGGKSLNHELSSEEERAIAQALENSLTP